MSLLIFNILILLNCSDDQWGTASEGLHDVSAFRDYSGPTNSNLEQPLQFDRLSVCFCNDLIVQNYFISFIQI